MTPQQQVIAKCKEMVARAQELYGMDLSNVRVRFDLKGRAAGQAYRRGGEYGVRFNHDMMTREAFEHLLNETVPHEYAHIICFMNPQHGRNHDYGWARVCSALGGSAKRTHSEEIVYGKGRTFEYTTTNGHKVRLSETMHKKVQRGVAYNYRQGKGTVNMFCTYTLVGVSGRSIAQPVTPRPQNHPAAIEEFVKQRAIEALPRPEPKPVAPAFESSASKGSIARSIMLAATGKTKDEIVAAIMFATGHTKQMANAFYITNAVKMGLPV